MAYLTTMFGDSFFQKSCIDFVIQAKPLEVYIPEEQTGCLYHVWRLVTSPPFENFILFLIVLNTVLLMMKVMICTNVLTSVQAEKTKIANPTFLVDFDLNFHMPGHFYL